ncbi:(2Fe-2S)-binding protein [Pendulispora rubella]|uniref:(2Fe-2S)-binding protein n=1 Tax=Pendulispora rubella TaxID=2741070 RepID=A0ABZ2KWI6_9BACT
MPISKFVLNGRDVRIDVDPETPLLWVIREQLGLTGTKYGCGRALCGACTVHLDGKAIRSCVYPVSEVEGRQVTTIEGLNGGVQHPLQAAWIAENVPQCGYCQSGQIMGAAAMLAVNPAPNDEDIASVMGAHLCRCGTYPRIRLAIHRAAAQIGRSGGGR